MYLMAYKSPPPFLQIVDNESLHYLYHKLNSKFKFNILWSTLYWCFNFLSCFFIKPLHSKNHIRMYWVPVLLTIFFRAETWFAFLICGSIDLYCNQMILFFVIYFLTEAWFPIFSYLVDKYHVSKLIFNGSSIFYYQIPLLYYDSLLHCLASD